MTDMKNKFMIKASTTVIKTFDVKETSYSEIISAINHMINRVVDEDDCKDHYVINIKKDDHIFIVAGDVYHCMQKERKVSFSTINTSIDQINYTTPKDILEEVERRLKDFLDSVPKSLEERVTKLEETVYNNKSNKEKDPDKLKQCNTDTTKYTNDVVDEIKVIYRYADEKCYLINSIVNLRYVLTISISYIKKCHKNKASRLILLKEIDESNKYKTLFAVLICKESDGSITINCSPEFNDTTDDIIKLRKEKLNPIYNLNLKNQFDEADINKAILTILQIFVECCTFKEDYITIDYTRMMDKHDFINNIKDVLVAIEIKKIPVVIKMSNKKIMPFGGLEWLGYKYIVIDPLNSEDRYYYYQLDDKIDSKKLISIKDILDAIYDNY